MKWNRRKISLLIYLFWILFLSFQSSAFATLSDVTDDTDLVKSGMAICDVECNPAFEMKYQDVAIQNVSGSSLAAPLMVAVTSISDQDVTVANPDGVTESGLPYFFYDAEIAGGTLDPAVVSANKRWYFYNPGGASFTYTASVYCVTADTTPPEIRITNPVDGASLSNHTPLVTIEFTDTETGIDPGSLTVTLNGGADIADQFALAGNSATCQLALPLGTSTISASIRDGAGNQGNATATSQARFSSQEARYVFSLKNSDWIFASPGDGTYFDLAFRTDLGIPYHSDILGISRIFPAGEFFFSLLDRRGIFQSSSEAYSRFLDHSQLGLLDSDQISDLYIGHDGLFFFTLEGQPDIFQSEGANSHALFLQNSRLGLLDTDPIHALHIGYDGAVYFCTTGGQSILQSSGDNTNHLFLTAADLGVPTSEIDAFAILPETDGPSLSIINPPDESIINTRTPLIQIAFSDAEAGIDTASFHAEINGTDSTSSFSVDGTGASYQVASPLPLDANQITASISDRLGNQSTATSSFTVNDLAATLLASPSQGSVPLEVHFEAQVTGGAGPYTYSWDLNGDGTEDDTRASFNHVYQSRGTYAVQLMVTDGGGRTVSDTAAVYALSAPAVHAYATPTEGAAPLAGSFSATVNDADGSIVLYEWDFDGDGVYDYSSASTAETAFTYNAAGLYQAILRVKDNDDLIVTDSVFISVGSPPGASASAAPMTGAAPLEVTFAGTGSDGDGSIALYEWDFNGDDVFDWSSTSTGDTSFTYTSSGIFDATLQVTDNHGLIGRDSVLISVSGPPIAKPGAFPTSGTAPLTVTFFTDGEDLDGSPEFYDWDFDGDGYLNRQLSASMNTTYTYSDPGTYNATLTVIDNDGLTGSASISITVAAPIIETQPTAIADAVPTNGGAPLTVTLIGKGTDNDGTIAKYEWDYDGDGVFDYEESVSPGRTLGPSIDVGEYSSPEFADIDNDGDLDLFVGSDNGRITFYRNEGSGSSPVWADGVSLSDSNGDEINISMRSKPSFADIDSDGDLDLFIGSYNGRISLHRNTGNSSSPVWNYEGFLSDSAGTGIDVGTYSSPAFPDIDNDGDFDLLIGQFSGRISFYRNEGTSSSPVWTSDGFLTDSVGATIDAGSFSKPEVADLDIDGDLDLFIGSDGGRIYFYENTGTSSSPGWTPNGVLTDTAGSAIDVGFCSGPVFVDTDNDGVLELYIGGDNGKIQIYSNTGIPSDPSWSIFTSKLGFVGASSYCTPSLADIDADGDFDLFIGNQDGRISFYRSDYIDGVPFFTLVAESIRDSGNILIDIGVNSSPAFTDIDSDGDLDLFIGEGGGCVYFYRNDGTGNSPVWEPMGLLTDSSGDTLTCGAWSSPEFADIDSDGDYDLLLGGNGGRIRLYLNNGTSSDPAWAPGQYVTDLNGTTIDVGSHSGPELVDIDNDGDLDLLVGEWNGRIVSYQNIGAMHSPVWQPEGLYRDSSGVIAEVGSYSIPECADLDNDGDFVLLVGNGSGYVYFFPTSGYVKHDYLATGTFQATLRVTDNSGDTATDAVWVTILEAGAPTAEAAATPTSGPLPLPVTFYGSGSDPDGAIALFEWDFDGDGTYEWSSATTGRTSFTYDQIGPFAATLRVTDNEGKTSTASIKITPSLSLSTERTDIFNPVSGESGAITTTMTGTSTVSVEIIDHEGNVIRSLVADELRSTGSYTDAWDGKDEFQNIVNDGIYYFRIMHTENGETRILDLRETAQYQERRPGRTWPATFNPFEEDYAHVIYSLSKPAEVSLYFWKRDESRPESAIAPVRTLLLREPLGAGSHTAIWDGVNDEGVVVGPWPGGYPTTLWAYDLPENAIIITGNRPVVSGIQADPNYFSPAYNSYSPTGLNYATITFNLSEPANVEVSIKDSTGATVDSFNRPGLPEGENTILWEGQNFAGEFVKDGTYSLSVTATDNHGHRSLPRYAALVIYY